jgi:hypothetical protein
MDMQPAAIRELSGDECETVSGGLGFIALGIALAIGAGAGVGLAFYLDDEEEVLIPDIQFPS